MADSTLTAIRTKIRRLTRTPSPNQMSDAVLDDYINTFIQYDFPESLRLISNRISVSFFTIPYVDRYTSNTVATDDPLYNFSNKYTNVFSPIYVDGVKAFYTQSRENFYNIYPRNRTTVAIDTGDGLTVSYSGTLSNIPVMQNNVTFTSIGANKTSLALVDVPVVDASGNPTVNGNLYSPDAVPSESPTVVFPNFTINYATGVYSITFPSAPANDEPILANTLPYQGSRPSAVLFWNNTFFFRPVPIRVYEVSVEVDMRPLELLVSTQSPKLQQWWQYIAYGASKKILEDRMDMETVMKIMPEFENQERLVLRRTIVQQTEERTPSIYVEQASLYGGPGFNNTNNF